MVEIPVEMLGKQLRGALEELLQQLLYELTEKSQGTLEKVLEMSLQEISKKLAGYIPGKTPAILRGTPG